MRIHGQSRSNVADIASPSRAGTAAGKRTLTAGLAGSGAPIQAKAAVVADPASPGTPAPDVGPTLDAAVRPDLFVGQASSGSALPGDVRTQMERSLGADFSNVRVREDASAATLGADAYARRWC